MFWICVFLLYLLLGAVVFISPADPQIRDTFPSSYDEWKGKPFEHLVIAMVVVSVGLLLWPIFLFDSIRGGIQQTRPRTITSAVKTVSTAITTD